MSQAEGWTLKAHLLPSGLHSIVFREREGKNKKREAFFLLLLSNKTLESDKILEITDGLKKKIIGIFFFFFLFDKKEEKIIGISTFIKGYLLISCLPWDFDQKTHPPLPKE